MSYEQALARLAQSHPGLVVMTAENRAHIRSLPALLGPRFIDVGIAEQTLVGMAAGLALCGRTPVVHALAPFLTMRAFEFIRTDVGIAKLPVKLVGFVPGVLSDANGPTHQSLEDLSLMRGIPGMQVFCPADGAELEAALESIVDAPGPCYVRYTAREPVVAHTGPVHIGSAEVLYAGIDATLVSFGVLLEQAQIARATLNTAGLSVGLINLRWLSPVDERALIEAAIRTRVLVTIEDHFRHGGLYSLVCELLVREGVSAKVIPIAFDARWFTPGKFDAVLEHEGLSGKRIAERVLSAL
jgi:transketolase